MLLNFCGSPDPFFMQHETHLYTPPVLRGAALFDNSGPAVYTIRVKFITGSLVTLNNLFPQHYRYRYRLEIRMNSFNYHYRYRLGIRSHPFISVGSQLPS